MINSLTNSKEIGNVGVGVEGKLLDKERPYKTVTGLAYKYHNRLGAYKC